MTNDRTELDEDQNRGARETSAENFVDQSNDLKEFVENGPSIGDETFCQLFQSAVYKSFVFETIRLKGKCCFEHFINVRHGPFLINLIFHHDDQFRVTGNGTDDVGNFNVNGFYSIKTLRLAFRKDYSAVDNNNNVIRSSEIQSQWMFDADQFEGNSTSEFFTMQRQLITDEHEDLI